MKINFLLILLFVCAQSQSFASQQSKPNSEVQILSNFDVVGYDNTFSFLKSDTSKDNPYSVVTAKDGSAYMFILRNNKLAYFKKPARGGSWEQEALVNIASGIPNTYPKKFEAGFVYTYGDNLVKMVVRGKSLYAETRTLTLDLSTMTLVSNELTSESTDHLFEEFRDQNAPPPTPGPQMPVGSIIYRLSKMQNSKGIYYYRKLIRQDDGRIAEKQYYRVSTKGVWAKEHEVGQIVLPRSVATSYERDKIKMIYGEDLTKDHFILVGMRRKKEAPKNLSEYIFLVYRQKVASGLVSLEILERNLLAQVPPLPDGFWALMMEASYNQKSSELSVATTFSHARNNQVFNVYNMDRKELVRARAVEFPNKSTQVFSTNLSTKQGEAIGLQYSRGLTDVANFSFVEWSGSGEQKFYKISKGPRPNFNTAERSMIWSDDYRRIYTCDHDGTICESNLDAGSLRCVSPELPESADGGSAGSLRVVRDGVVELVSKSQVYNAGDSRNITIYSATINFNDQ